MKHNKKILIVEDDAFLVDAYKVKLASMPWKIITTTNGDAAYDITVKEKPNLIILDLLIEGLTGLEVLRKLRSSPATKDVPIIVATNVNQDESVNKAKELGANDYFIKSNISIGDLVKKCQDYL